MVKNIFHINDQSPTINSPLPVNRIISSSFKRYEIEKPGFGFSLKIPQEGREKYIIGNKAFTVGPGEYFLTNNGQVVGYELKNEIPIKGLCVYLDETLVRKSLSQFSFSERHLLDSPDDLRIEELISGKFVFDQGPLYPFIKKFTLGKVGDLSQEELELWFYEVGLAIGTQILLHQKRKLNLGIKKKSTRDEIYERLQVAKQFLHDQLNRPLSIKEVADCASFSEFHFIRSFKLCFGTSPYQYLTKIRIERAKELIRSQCYPLAEIAIICGFHDEFMFSKIFKKVTGMPPSIYRKMGR